jgi:uncharacterized protein YukE
MGHTEVKVGELRDHAGQVAKLGRELTKAGETGGNVELGGETYGIIGQAFAGGAKDSIHGTAQAIKDLAATFADVAAELSECADEYQRTDDDNSVMFKVGD